MRIEQIRAREIYNAAGWPTIACDLRLTDGHVVHACVPTGTSRGTHEAKFLYDGGDRLFGRGVQKAIEHINITIAKEFVLQEPHAINMDIKLLELDGTSDKSHLGANALLAVSMAIYRAHAYIEKVELYEFIGYMTGAETVSLPFPLFNMINGGMHAHNSLQIQEFLVIPAGASDFRTSMEAGALIFHELGTTLKKLGKPLAFGLEGGYSSDFTDEYEALDILSNVLVNVKQRYGVNSLCALDVAASHFYDKATKTYLWRGRPFSSDELITIYKQMVEAYPLCSIEDGLDEDDWGGWATLCHELKNSVQIVGDDLFVTSPQRIDHGAKTSAATAVIIKPDQIGTVTETLQAIRVCRENGLLPIVSHRSGETNDTFIADLAVGTSAGQIKTGGLCRGERLAKYNRLLAIEDQLAGA